MSTQEIFGKSLSSLREERKISRAQLAEATMVSPQAVGKWERGESLPDIFCLKRIADIFGVSMETLLCFDDGIDKTFASGNSEMKQEKQKDARPAWDLSMSNWKDADFSDLKNAVERFNYCNIINCKLSRVALAGVTLKANAIKNCDFSSADLSRSKLTACSIQRNNFSEASFKEATIKSCSISDSDFSSADFSGAKISHGQIRKNSFDRVKLYCTSFRFTVFSNLTIQSDIADCSFINCQFRNLTFKNMRFTNTFFRNHKHKKCQFINCTADSISYAFLASSKVDLTGLTVTREEGGKSTE